MEYRVDRDRAWEVLGKIWNRYSANGYPYQGHEHQLPQSHFPALLPRRSASEAYYWLVLCIWMRGGNNSTTSAKGLARLYDDLQTFSGPNPFKPRVAARQDPVYLSWLADRVGLGMYQAMPYWIANARVLNRHYGGDVRNIFAGVSNYDQLTARVLDDPRRQLAGFAYKMTSMLCYYLMEADLITPFPYPMPVDFHLQRVAIANRLIIRVDQPKSPVFANYTGDYAKIERLLRELYLDYATTHGIPSNRFADALWILSRSLCRYNPGNRTHQVGVYDARATPLEAHKPDWNSTRDRKGFARSCQQCPVRASCELNVRAGPRYRGGQLIVSIREEPAILEL